LGTMEKDKYLISCLRQGLGFVFLVAILVGFSVSAFAEIDTPYGKLDIRTRTKYRFQWSNSPDSNMVPDDSNDQDFEEQIGLDWDWAEKGVTSHFLGRYRKDLDGTPEGSIFQDYNDVCNSHRREVQLYYGYLDFHDVIPDYDIRLGRQYVFGVENNIQLDGLWVRGDRAFNLDWLSFEAYGGVPSQPYADLESDGIGGLNLEFYPVKNLVLHADTTFYKENSWEVYGDWRPYSNLRTDAHLAFINYHPRYAYLNCVGDIERTGTTLGFKFYRNFEIQENSDFILDWQSPEKDLGEDIKRLYLTREQAYYQFDLSISQQIPTQEGLAIFSRLGIRELMDNDDEDLYTTDFLSVTAGISIDEWLYLQGFHCSLGVTRWKEDRDTYYEAESTSFFADLRQEIFDQWAIAGGYYYKTEDVNSLIENEAAHNYYASVSYRMDENKWAELKYEYERDDYYKEFGISDLHSLTATVHFRF